MAGKDSPRPQSWRWFSNLDSSYILLIKLILLQYSFEINACIFLFTDRAMLGRAWTRSRPGRDRKLQRGRLVPEKSPFIEHNEMWSSRLLQSCPIHFTSPELTWTGDDLNSHRTRPRCYHSFLKRNAIEHYKLTNMVLAMMVAVEMDNKQLASRHVVVIRQVVAISSKNSSACFFFKSWLVNATLCNWFGAITTGLINGDRL